MSIRVLKAGDVYRIEGPAKVVVRRGQVYATGVVYTEGQSFTVLRARRLVIKALSESEVELVLGPGALLERVDPREEIIDEWESKTASIDPKGVIVIVGMIDVGKSTMTAMLGNKALARGYKVAIIDADVGQNDLGPPTTVSLARLTKYITHLRQLVAEKSIFLQATSLERIWPRAIEQIARAVDFAKRSWQVDTIILNTDGWVLDEEAVVFKRRLIDVIKPSLIIAIQVEKELAPVLDGYNNVVVLPPPPQVRSRSREDRKIHREMGYGRYIFPPVELAIPLDKIPICNLPIFKGIEIGDELKRILARAIGTGVLKAYQVGNRVYAIIENDAWVVRRVSGFQVIGLPIDFEKGLLVGLEDAEHFLVGLGVMKRIYYDRRKAIIYTSSEVERRIGEVKCIRLGLVRLDDNFNEVEKAYSLLKAEHE
ncbi:Clp1/GlmU family protein [Pyrobaculum aerophilum]|uniref:Clp1/GlmU family protein n=1 Tax=Pyrobaculum aerophilum TaxID=13773 RepID=UPI0023F2FD67|nr:MULTISPECIES: Clp1/GlmU family protein [Pyrobaculum]MCX8135800.1 Clp1/GlmU family protein [Pyrobaculum aerophilum]